MIRNFYSRRKRMQGRGPIQNAFQSPPENPYLNVQPVTSGMPQNKQMVPNNAENPMLNTMPVTGQAQPFKTPPPQGEIPGLVPGIGFDPNITAKKKTLAI